MELAIEGYVVRLVCAPQTPLVGEWDLILGFRTATRHAPGIAILSVDGLGRLHYWWSHTDTDAANNGSAVPGASF